ncbi:MAG: pyruvate:ferredoxin (flavodoxin) oxidoreductase [Clostridiales bacterium]|nr:pyruvate:ferredoxin (flavodoxin) oxidoreductase [Clostridiales bacterium]
MKKVTIDGNFAASNIAYMFNNVAMIYPITPSSPMAENCDQMMYDGKQNIFGNTLRLSQMQSEAGVAGAVHGSLIAGEKTTTFTSSQGLLLMIPNMYKIAGEGLPTVFYVAARSVATHALNIFCDYSDIYACLKTGFNIVNCSSVQEVNDIAIACELASVRSGIPYICFFDGFRTSHELNTIYQTELSDLQKIVNPTMFAEFTNRAINCHEAKSMGTNQNPDVFMQNRVRSIEKYSHAIADFEWALQKSEEITTRHYDTIEYLGDTNAKDVVVSIGSSADVLALAKTQYKGKVGIIKVRMLKPFDEKKFVSLLPKGVKNITILERNLDVNGTDTLTSFVLSALQKNSIHCKTYSGCYGLGGKEFTPDMAIAVFENMLKKKKEFFTVGVYDDVTHTNLEIKDNFVDKSSDFSMRVYGLGSDGSVSSVKNIIKIIGEETASYMQGYFDYDSKKSGSLTISHMRSSFLPINAPFNPRGVNLVSCNNEGYIKKYDITACLNKSGILLLNTGYDFETLDRVMPDKMKHDLIEKNITLYAINANDIARECGLGSKINTIMQTAIFKVSKLLPFDVAMKNIETSIIKSYSRKGQKIVDANLKAIKDVVEKIKEIDVHKFSIKNVPVCKVQQNEYYEEIIVPTSNQEGNDIPVSKFSPDGHMPTDTAKYEKRALAEELPKWISDKCIQCGRCTMMCPHAAIRPVIVDEKKKTPKSFTTRKAFICDGNYRMQVNTLDCTGCGVCSSVCPVKALIMTASDEIRDEEIANEQFMLTLPDRTPFTPNTVKGVQFKKPYFEFSGACAGCGETPYIKLATQLFGDRMLIANATGCSSIYGGTYPTCPYSKDKDGFGPSWANSLFEDNAEFGYGIALARKNQRENFIKNLKNMRFSKKIQEFLVRFLENTENHEFNKQFILWLKDYRRGHVAKYDDTYLYHNLHLITSPSVWIIGGDGWAYDIGFGGLDHVVASGENVNILILDSEVYSNTGGQTSKATPRGATAKFNLSGKTTKKKDLASMLMTYKDVYVASVSMGANPDQCVQAFVEAEQYDGPSVIIAYSPCISHGYNMRESQIHAFNSVKSGYNTLFRYNPSAKEPMLVDSYEPTMNYREYVESENRFTILEKVNKANMTKLLKQSESDAKARRQTYLNQQKLNKK